MEVSLFPLLGEFTHSGFAIQEVGRQYSRPLSLPLGETVLLTSGGCPRPGLSSFGVSGLIVVQFGPRCLSTLMMRGQPINPIHRGFISSSIVLDVWSRCLHRLPSQRSKSLTSG